MDVPRIFVMSLKFFFLMTPFFVLSLFLSITAEYTGKERKILAWKVALSALAVCLVLLFFGRWIFSVFGITLDAFRIGGGALLFLVAVKLVNGTAMEKTREAVNPDSDIAVVPLAIPVTVGPATAGALLVLGGEASGWLELSSDAIGLLLALTALWLLLHAAALLERILKKRGITILSKLTGLILAAIASEMIFTGIRSFLK